MSKIRGIRNNNPGNIRRTADKWVGMSADQSADPDFVVFDAPEYGIRALARIMRTHWENGSQTLRQLIELWAPPSENDTEAYLSDVTRHSGLTADVPITDIELALPLIIPAVIQHENGIQPYPATLVALGIDLEQTA
jgi:hypothetical protein